MLISILCISNKLLNCDVIYYINNILNYNYLLGLISNGAFIQLSTLLKFSPNDRTQINVLR